MKTRADLIIFRHLFGQNFGRDHENMERALAGPEDCPVLQL